MMDLTLHSVCVHIVDINSPIVKSIVCRLNTFRYDVSHEIEPFDFVPFAHEPKFLEVPHWFVRIWTSGRKF